MKMNLKSWARNFGMFACIVLTVLIFTPCKAHASEQVTGGTSRAAAVEIELDKDYEAVVPLVYNENTGDYFGKVWYKVKLPQYTSYVGLATDAETYNDYNSIGVNFQVSGESDDWNASYAGIYYELFNSYTSNLNNVYHVDYYNWYNDDSYCYIEAWTSAPVNGKFRVVAGVNPSEEDQAAFGLNQEYTEKFYFDSNARKELCTSFYSFTAPYTGKYRIICDSKNGNANCGIYYYTGQMVDSFSCEKNKQTSKIISLQSGMKYIVEFSGNEISASQPMIATFYISSQQVESIDLEETAITLNKAEQYQILPLVLPERAVDPSVTYSSSDTKVATVSKDGCITAVKGGKAVITIDSNDGSGVQAKITVTVKKKMVTRLDLSASKLVLKKNTGKSLVIKAKTYPTNADNRTVTFRSSNSKIVAVDKKTGKLHPKKAGTVTITCVTNDGSKLKKKCKVIVKKSYFY